jgi:hypothetical protein
MQSDWAQESVACPGEPKAHHMPVASKVLIDPHGSQHCREAVSCSGENVMGEHGNETTGQENSFSIDQ